MEGKRTYYKATKLLRSKGCRATLKQCSSKRLQPYIVAHSAIKTEWSKYRMAELRVIVIKLSNSV